MADVLTRVPLVARGPGFARGHVATGPVQNADVLETMLDLAGITNTSADPGWVRFATSLRPQLEGTTPGDPNRFVYSEGGFFFSNERLIEADECLASCPQGMYCPRGQEEQVINGSPRASMIRNLTSKLVYRPTGVSELYDLVSDPRELSNLYASAAPAHAALRSDLERRLLRWYALTSDVTPTAVDSRGPPQVPDPLPGGDPWAGNPARGAGSEGYAAQDDLMVVNGVIED